MTWCVWCTLTRLLGKFPFHQHGHIVIAQWFLLSMWSFDVFVPTCLTRCHGHTCARLQTKLCCLYAYDTVMFQHFRAYSVDNMSLFVDVHSYSFVPSSSFLPFCKYLIPFPLDNISCEPKDRTSPLASSVCTDCVDTSCHCLPASSLAAGIPFRICRMHKSGIGPSSYHQHAAFPSNAAHWCC